MDPQWLGPYEIATDLGKGFYALSDLKSGDIVTRRVNAAHLKAYLAPPPHHADASAETSAQLPCSPQVTVPKKLSPCEK